MQYEYDRERARVAKLADARDLKIKNSRVGVAGFSWILLQFCHLQKCSTAHYMQIQAVTPYKSPYSEPTGLERRRAAHRPIGGLLGITKTTIATPQLQEQNAARIRRCCMKIVTILLILAGLSRSALGGDKSAIKEVRDVPLGITFYYPSKPTAARHGVTTWKVFPYVAAGDSRKKLLLQIVLSTGAWAPPWCFEEVILRADGQTMPLNVASSQCRRSNRLSGKLLLRLTYG